MAARRRSRLASASATLLVAGAILSASGASVSARPVVELRQMDAAVQSSTATPVGDTLGSHASISGDGRFVVYQGSPGAATGDVAPADPRTSTVYLTDRQDGSTAC